MKIGIAGCGGIGSNVALHLARTGIGNLKLIDFDKIEQSNLNRQFFFKNQIGRYKSETLMKNLLSIEETLNLEFIVTKIEKNNIHEIFEDCDIVVEAFDNKVYKKLLIESCRDKIIVSANGIGGRDFSEIKYQNFGNLHIVGDFRSDVKDYKTYSTKVMLTATVMADIVINILEGKHGK